MKKKVFKKRIEAVYLVLSSLLITSPTYAMDYTPTPECSRILKDSSDYKPYQRAAKPSDAFTIILNGEVVTLTEPIITFSGAIYLPVRAISEFLDIDVEYISEYNVVLVRDPTTYLEIPLGFSSAVSSEKRKDIGNGNRSLIYNERTYLPLRFVADQLQSASIDYKSSSKSIIISTNKNPEITLGSGRIVNINNLTADDIYAIADDIYKHHHIPDFRLVEPRESPLMERRGYKTTEFTNNLVVTKNDFWELMFLVDEDILQINDTKYPCIITIDPNLFSVNFSDFAEAMYSYSIKEDNMNYWYNLNLLTSDYHLERMIFIDQDSKNMKGNIIEEVVRNWEVADIDVSDTFETRVRFENDDSYVMINFSRTDAPDLFFVHNDYSKYRYADVENFYIKSPEFYMLNLVHVGSSRDEVLKKFNLDESIADKVIDLYPDRDNKDLNIYFENDIVSGIECVTN